MNKHGHLKLARIFDGKNVDNTIYAVDLMVFFQIYFKFTEVIKTFLWLNCILFLPFKQQSQKGQIMCFSAHGVW